MGSIAIIRQSKFATDVYIPQRLEAMLNADTDEIEK